MYKNSIALQTKKGNDIKNAQYFQLSNTDLNEIAGLRKNYLNITERVGPTNIYNCHGLVFASRRTGIDESNELEKILNEDAYQEIDPKNVLPGDIIVYYDNSNNIDHSGIVVETPNEKNFNIPFILSKWGKFSEVLHYANNCPYNIANCKYFRMRN